MSAMLTEGNAFIRSFPPNQGIGVAAAMAYANPFFLPDVPSEFIPRLAIGIDAFGEATMRAKLTAAHSKTLAILVATPPQAGSEVLANGLERVLGLPRVTLTAATYDVPSLESLGGIQKEAEVDELALIRNGLNGKGYVASQNVRANPFSCRLMGLYGVRPVVLSRSIPDTIVALDEDILARRAQPEGRFGRWFDDGMPDGFHTMEPDDRHMMLADRFAIWLTSFQVSWRKCARAGLIRPLFLSYEADILGDKGLLAARLSDHLALPFECEDALAMVLGDRGELVSTVDDLSSVGRGQVLSDRVMDELMLVHRAYRDEEDIACLMPH